MDCQCEGKAAANYCVTPRICISHSRHQGQKQATVSPQDGVPAIHSAQSPFPRLQQPSKGLEATETAEMPRHYQVPRLVAHHAVSDLRLSSVTQYVGTQTWLACRRGRVTRTVAADGERTRKGDWRLEVVTGGGACSVPAVGSLSLFPRQVQRHQQTPSIPSVGTFGRFDSDAGCFSAPQNVPWLRSESTWQVAVQPSKCCHPVDM